MSFIKYTIAAAFIGLFAIALITFAANFGTDNDAAINIADDPDYAQFNTQTNTDVEIFYANSTVAYDAYQASTISSQTEASEGGTSFKVTLGSSASIIKNAVSAPWKKVFGQDSSFNIIFTGLMALLGIILLAYGYKAWKGNPD